MSRVRVERSPIQGWVGIFGGDHLILSYQPAPFLDQVHWYGIEGARVTFSGSPTPTLAVLGANGTTTLATLNAFYDGTRYRAPDETELANIIGTPEQRGSRALPLLNPDAAWATMASYARQIDAQAYPYTAVALPFTANSALNSTSLIASLLHYAGTNLSTNLPFGLRLSPGRETLLGTGADEEMRIENGFTSLHGGGGADIFFGAEDLSVRERFYGGSGDDTFNWSKGSHVFHGGVLDLLYIKDGIDTVVYDQIGPFYVRLPAIDHVPHFNAQFVVEHATGEDWLLSIERLEWRDKNDFIKLGPGVDLIREGLDFHLGGQSSAAPSDDRGDVVDFTDVEGGGLLINAVNSHTVFAQASQTDLKGLWIEDAEWVVGTAGDDRIYLSEGMRGAEGGSGDDLIDARLAAGLSGPTADGDTARLEGGVGDDTIVSTSGKTLAIGGAGSDRFVLSNLTGLEGAIGKVEFVIDEAGSDDRLFVPYDYFTGVQGEGQFDGSELLPLLGAIGTYADMRDNGYVLRFEWRLEDDYFFGHDFTEGIINFTGSIEYSLDGDDLLINIYQGETVENPVLGDFGELLYTETLLLILDDETTIRVTDFAPGDLGIEFHDPGEGTNISLPGGFAATTYANFDAAVNILTNGGTLTEPLDPRPEAPTSNPNHDDETGGSDPQVASGTGANDFIAIASAADHDISGGGGDDMISGGDGNDKLDGGTGNDTLEGGNGDDGYVVDSTADVVIEAAGGGNDRVISTVDYTLTANVESLSLIELAVSGTGNGLDNTLTGNDLANAIDGAAGNDTLIGKAGNDTLDGGEGSDTFVYSLGDGDDLIRDSGAAGDTDRLYLPGLTAADITFLRHEDSLDDLRILFSDGANLTVEDYFSATLAGAGIDAIAFDADPALTRTDIDAFIALSGVTANAAPQAVADNTYTVYGHDILLPAGALLENDRDLDGDTLTIVAVGTPSLGMATLLAGGDISLIVPAGTEDVVTFTYTIEDSAGATSTAEVSLLVGPENIAPEGVADGPIDIARDAAMTFLASDLLANDTDPDGGSLFVASVGNAVNGTVVLDAEGTITFTPEAGHIGTASFTYTAGDGTDESAATLVDLIVHDVTEIAGTSFNNAITGTAGWDRILGFEGSDVIFGGDGQDVLEGGDGNDVLHGGDGHDTLIGGNNGDALYGNAGNDILDGGSGVDVLFGEDGADILFGGKSGDTLVGGAGNDDLYGGDGDDSLDGGDGEDVLQGEAGIDTLNGGIGNDLLDGGGGYDSLDGGDGADQLLGDVGNDTLVGGNGDDTLHGGTGTDLLDGGTGDDTHYGDEGADTFLFAPGGGNDTILDFEWGVNGSDKIDLSAFGLTSLADVTALATETNGDTLIALDPGTSVKLLGVAIADLHVDDIILS
ncbi:MAG: cadherin-like domain-containing protein [Alphaproteobacteria bacterium]|nr:cadherin-like domain-containing protein [Alphaproteobacteria bacterium]